jgi:hypothetical protein
MGKLIKDFWTDETAPRRAFRALLLAAGTVGGACAQQLTAAFPGHQAGIIAACGACVALAGMIGSKTGPAASPIDVTVVSK